MLIHFVYPGLAGVMMKHSTSSLPPSAPLAMNPYRKVDKLHPTQRVMIYWKQVFFSIKICDELI